MTYKEDLTPSIADHVRGWGAYMRKIAAGAASSIALPPLIAWASAYEATGDNARFGLSTHLHHIAESWGHPETFIPVGDTPLHEPNYVSSAFLGLHVISDSMSLAREKNNVNPLLWLAGQIEDLQNNTEITLEATLKSSPLFKSIRAMAEGLVYTSVLLTPHIAPMVNEIFLNIKDSSQHPYPLPIILSSLFFIGLANISLDSLRVTAGLARLNQQHIAQTNKGILDDFIARIAGSMTVDPKDEKMRVPHDRLIREAIVAAGITPEMARFSEHINFSTEHAHAAAVNMQEALNRVPSSSRERLYPDEQKKHYENVVKAARAMVPFLKRAARDYHTNF